MRLIIFDWDDVFSQGSTAEYHRRYYAALEAVGVRLAPNPVDRACAVYEQHHSRLQAEELGVNHIIASVAELEPVLEHLG